jgi:hypothetical protein
MGNMKNLYIQMQDDALRLDKDSYLEEYKDHLADAHNIWERMNGPEGRLEHPDIVTTNSIGKERGNR